MYLVKAFTTCFITMAITTYVRGKPFTLSAASFPPAPSTPSDPLDKRTLTSANIDNSPMLPAIEWNKRTGAAPTQELLDRLKAWRRYQYTLLARGMLSDDNARRLDSLDRVIAQLENSLSTSN